MIKKTGLFWNVFYSLKFSCKKFKTLYFSFLPSGQSFLTPFTQYEPFGQGVQAPPSSYSPKLQLDETLTPVAVIESLKKKIYTFKMHL